MCDRGESGIEWMLIAQYGEIHFTTIIIHKIDNLESSLSGAVRETIILNS